MALKIMLVVVAIAAAASILPNAAMAMQYVVGDDQGWGLKVNYTAWAEGKEFFVGDSLVFKYKPEAHNVYKVSGPEFRACQVSNATEEGPLTSGNDEITLATPGRKWYLCGVADHCTSGMKLLITVQPSSAPPSPSPSSPPQSSAATAMVPYSISFVVAASALLMKAFFA